MATPALRALRAAQPQAEILLMGRSAIAELVQGLASIDRFLTEPGRGMKALAGHARQLRESGVDWAVLLPDSVRAALGPFLARIPLRVGYARDAVRRALITHALEPPRANGRRFPVSMIERYLRITRALGCPDAGEDLELPVDPEARTKLERRLAAAGLAPDAELLVVTPGAAFGESKLWPPEHFAEACDALSEKHGLRVVLAPAPGEEPIVARIVARMHAPVVNLVDPPTRLGELAALIERGRLLLTNDTGPRHMATALRRPVISLLGPTDPRHTEHLLARQRVLREPVECSPCHLKVCPIDHRCMVLLRPERVVQAAAELLA